MDINVVLEFNKIKNLWKEFTFTDYAKKQIENGRYSLDERELRKSLKDTTDARVFIEKCGAPPLTSTDEAKEILEQAKKESCLTAFQLERVEKVLVAVRRLKDYLNRGKMLENSLAYYELNLNSMDELCEEIGMQIRGGVVDDHASKILLQIRNDIQKAEDKMKQKADAIMRANKSCMADNFTTLRNGRICVPVKKECKAKISGSVIDKSATGNTLFIEPAGVAEQYEEIQMLRIDEENEVYRILYTLTAMVVDGADIMEENIRIIERLDYVFSKGKLSLEMDAVEPSINLERKISLKSARHPLMDRTVNVPLNFEIGGEVTGIIITGPNTGGKTVSIKTVALNCLMAQSGLHVTCKEADICMNSSYLCDIGDGQNITENLSTFSAHIKNVMEIVKEVDEDSLVIMDELGSGTDPTEGMGIAICILEELRKSGCLFLVTTHYPEVKEYADRIENIVNARMEFDRDTLKPTYRMVIGEAGESCAFYIAQRLGMSSTMLRNAVVAAYGEEAVEKYGIEKKEERADRKERKKASKIRKTKKAAVTTELLEKYQIGDSVMVLPDNKIGIVCKPINEKGMLCVQQKGEKIWISHKRVKLHVAASQLYPEDYDFSIIFDSVEQRKKRHDMGRKYVEEALEVEE